MLASSSHAPSVSGEEGHSYLYLGDQDHPPFLSFPPNYWLHWRPEDVLKRKVFFKLYEVFRDYEPEIVPSPDPFVGAMLIGQKLYHVFVARDDVYDLLLYMKWNRNPEQRIIVVAEKLEYLSPSNPFPSGLFQGTGDNR